MTGRQAATALGKLTWLFAVAFLATSIGLTILTAREQAGDSVLKRTAGTEIEVTEPDELSGGLLPPSIPDEPAAPPKAE